jgi:superfamily II DNA or RNA helicase
MLEKVKFIQETKVDELLTLTEVEGEKEYVLKAPTGSGKTYMQGYLISKLLTKYPNAKIIYQSLSKGSLAKQGYNSIIKYNFPNINPYLITTDKTTQESLVIPINYNVYFLPRDLNKEKGLIKSPLKDFLTYKTKENIKFLIIDECQESHSNIDPYVNEFD